METTPAGPVGPVEFSIYGRSPPCNQVVPGMRFLPGENRGTILFVNGGTALTPREGFVGTSIAFAGQAAYLEILHEVLEEDGIHLASW